MGAFTSQSDSLGEKSHSRELTLLESRLLRLRLLRLPDREYSDGKLSREKSLEASLWTTMNRFEPPFLPPPEKTDPSSKSIVSIRLIWMPGSSNGGSRTLPDGQSDARRFSAPWRRRELMMLLLRRVDLRLAAREERRDVASELRKKEQEHMDHSNTGVDLPEILGENQNIAGQTIILGKGSNN